MRQQCSYRIHRDRRIFVAAASLVGVVAGCGGKVTTTGSHPLSADGDGNQHQTDGGSRVSSDGSVSVGADQGGLAGALPGASTADAGAGGTSGVTGGASGGEGSFTSGDGGSRITEFSGFVEPNYITAGPDGNLWVTEPNANKICRVTVEGAVTEFPLPESRGPYRIVAGPDDNIWFTEIAGKIGRMTLDGDLTEFDVPNSATGPQDVGLDGITTGPDGNLWFTIYWGQFVGSMTPSGDVVQMIPTQSKPGAIVAGPDGNLWMNESSLTIGRVTPSGDYTEFPVPAAIGGEPDGIAVGSDGNLWFTEAGAGQIGRITTSGEVTLFDVPTPGGTPYVITAGPDGNLWFTINLTNKIARASTSGVIEEIRCRQNTLSRSGLRLDPMGTFGSPRSAGTRLGDIGCDGVGRTSSQHVRPLGPRRSRSRFRWSNRDHLIDLAE